MIQCLLWVVGLACAAGASDEAGEAYLTKNAKNSGVVVLASGLQYKV